MKTLSDCLLHGTVAKPRLYLPAPEVVVRKEEVFKHTKAMKQVRGKSTEKMNQTQQVASGQEICEQNLSQETSQQLHKILCELQRLLVSHLSWTSPEQMRSQVASHIQEQQNERGLNWECPGKVEFETVCGVLKKQKQLLQQECNEGKDTSQRKLFLHLLPSLWRYLQFQSASEENEQLNSARCSHFHHEWREFQQQNDILDRGTTFKQHLRMLISYLKDLTAGRRTDDSQATRYIEEINSGKVNPEL